MKPVVVSVTSIQRNEQGQELKMELVSEGKYYRKRDTQYIMYAESEITGLEGVTTIIKVLDNGNVVLVRTGKMQQRQEYWPGRETHSWYDTPLGRLPVTLKTYVCRSTLFDGTGHIELGYDVTIDGFASNYNQLSIDVQEDHA
ncbi:DUF1934 domain-containing protein [uncultured Megasphaera sp.]|uniref:DUF1934 domain-containing protein n=1 Tax=uncultured Megasphaera sp. TaxID=165188 RepID=UPI003784FF38